MVTLNTAIRGAQIETSTISGGHLATSNTPANGAVVAWDAANNQFKWTLLDSMVVNEVPFGDIDNNNRDFTLSNIPIESSEQVYLNGVLQEINEDYTISSGTISFVDPPVVGDDILVSYLVGGVVENTKPLNNVPYGYNMGGYDNTVSFSFVTRIEFPFDSGIANDVGYLSRNRTDCSAGCNSSTYGYNMGGRNSSTIERFMFPFDSGVAERVGYLQNFGYWYGLIGFNSSNYGFCSGGQNNTTAFSYISRITFPFDSGIADIAGYLSEGRYNAAGCNSSRHGYAIGGYRGWGPRGTIDRITFPFDSGTASYVGNLSHSISHNGGCNSSNYGYSMGGGICVERIAFPFDSGTASHVGNLTISRWGVAGFNSSDYGYSIGGVNGPTFASCIERIMFPFDSGVSIHVGNIGRGEYRNTGCDGTDFNMLFV